MQREADAAWCGTEQGVQVFHVISGLALLGWQCGPPAIYAGGEGVAFAAQRRNGWQGRRLRGRLVELLDVIAHRLSGYLTCMRGVPRQPSFEVRRPERPS